MWLYRSTWSIQLCSRRGLFQLLCTTSFKITIQFHTNASIPYTRTSVVQSRDRGKCLKMFYKIVKPDLFAIIKDNNILLR